LVADALTRHLLHAVTKPHHPTSTSAKCRYLA
jgi:hypothetical protein